MNWTGLALINMAPGHRRQKSSFHGSAAAHLPLTLERLSPWHREEPSQAPVEQHGSTFADYDYNSDFPSLAGGPRQPPNSNNNWGGNNSNAIRQPPIQQAPPQPRAPSAAPSQQSIDQFDGQRSQQQSTERSSGDDYPMPSNLMNGNGNGLTQTNGLGSSVGSPEDTHPQPNGQQSHTMASRDVSTIFRPYPSLRHHATSTLTHLLRPRTRRCNRLR